jgi:hypothetical protein
MEEGGSKNQDIFGAYLLISHNVQGWRCFCSPNKQNRKVLQGRKNVGGGLRGNGVVMTWQAGTPSHATYQAAKRFIQ